MIWDRFDVIAWKAHSVQPLQHITTVFLAQSRRKSFQWKRFLRQRWDVESATVVVAWSSWQRLEQAVCFILKVERQAAYLMILLDIFPHFFDIQVLSLRLTGEKWQDQRTPPVASALSEGPEAQKRCLVSQKPCLSKAEHFL